jgi:predicted nucleic acid-binding protein
MIPVDKQLKIVDSNLLIDFLLLTEDDELLDRVFLNPVYVNMTIFTETINFIQNKISFKDAYESAKIIIDHPELFLFLPVTPLDLDLGKGINRQYHSSKIGFSDSLILAQAENYGIPVYTRDDRMRIYPHAEVVNPYTL